MFRPRFFVCLLVCLFLLFLFFTPPHGWPYTVLVEFLSISGGLMLHKEFIIPEDSSHMNLQSMSTS